MQSAEKNGDLHDDLAIPNLLYGTALLELSRSENHVLGESMEKCGGSATSSEDEDNKETHDEVLKEVGQVCSEGTADVSEVNVGLPGVEQSNSENSGDEDVSTLQLAWEVVEVAKKLFMRHEDAEHQLKTSDCLEKLAEIGQEIGNHQQAISDLLDCLKLRLEYAPDNDRLIAETHFQLAVSYSQAGDAVSSDASFSDALGRLEVLNEGGGSKINHLQMQISEVVDLIAEVSERRKEGFQPIQMVREPQAKPVQSDVPADDITHLIKKKRPAGDENIQQVQKKSRVESSSHGSVPDNLDRLVGASSGLGGAVGGLRYGLGASCDLCHLQFLLVDGL
ncbi:Protein HGV2 [Taenia crassiceps]|uniref:Protein HGV2 n=1 Tax=Taenia crassiceps TaxID=6207 RepID=A0ABR4QDQ7_9CEST